MTSANINSKKTLHPKKIRILIADDHPLVVKGLTDLIYEKSSMHVVGIANNGFDLITQVNLRKPNVVITDIRMPQMDGLEAAEIIQENFPSVGMIALTADDRQFLMTKILEAGFKGILLKTADGRETLEAILAVANGQEYFCKGSLDIIKGLTQSDKLERLNKGLKPILTTQEEKVLMLVCEGYSSAAIGEQLMLGRRTIETHREKIMSKSNTNSLADLIKWAIKEGYVNVGR